MDVKSVLGAFLRPTWKQTFFAASGMFLAGLLVGLVGASMLNSALFMAQVAVGVALVCLVGLAFYWVVSRRGATEEPSTQSRRL